MQTFEKSEKKITEMDLDQVEIMIGHDLPESIRLHYLQHNGGTPSRSSFPATSKFDAILIATFFPMKYVTGQIDHGPATIEGKHSLMVTRQIIPAGLVPFAGDFGGNFFCLNPVDGAVSFFATDAFDPDMSAERNHIKAERRLAPSFCEFMGQLEEADS